MNHRRYHGTESADVNSLLAKKRKRVFGHYRCPGHPDTDQRHQYLSLRVANTEIFLARNEVVYQRNFYLAEGAALEAADHLTQYGNLRENTQAWMEMVTGDLDTDNVKYYWDNTVVSGDTVIPEPSEVDQSHTLFIIGTRELLKDFPWTWTSRRFMP